MIPWMEKRRANAIFFYQISSRFPPEGLDKPRHFIYRLGSGARIAQLVEQRTENPCVGGSSPSPGTILLRGGVAQLVRAAES